MDESLNAKSVNWQGMFGNASFVLDGRGSLIEEYLVMRASA